MREPVGVHAEHNGDGSNAQQAEVREAMRLRKHECISTCYEVVCVKKKAFENVCASFARSIVRKN